MGHHCSIQSVEIQMNHWFLIRQTTKTFIYFSMNFKLFFLFLFLELRLSS